MRSDEVAFITSEEMDVVGVNGDTPNRTPLLLRKRIPATQQQVNAQVRVRKQHPSTPLAPPVCSPDVNLVLPEYYFASDGQWLAFRCQR